MQTRIDLDSYKHFYEGLDIGHGWGHIERVRKFAIELGKKYCPEKLELIWVAATLHDIGISVSRENHESEGVKIILEDKEILNNYSKEEVEEIVHAVREHRASTGNPQTVIAKIISDADKASDDTTTAFQRAYYWGKKHLPNVNHEGQLLRAAYHLKVKFGEEGTGRRLYFPESEERIVKMYEPIFDALEVYDMEKFESFLK